MGRLFEKQPEWCRYPLDMNTVADFDGLHDRVKALVLFDPTEAYRRIDVADVINPFKRHNSVPIELIFPKIEGGVCRCGCNKRLTGRQTVWASEECRSMPLNVQMIICGHSGILNICRLIFGSDCIDCGRTEFDSHDVHELDHKHPVKFGGAGGWLSNYGFRCKRCHREKTNKDFGFKIRKAHPKTHPQ